MEQEVIVASRSCGVVDCRPGVRVAGRPGQISGGCAREEGHEGLHDCGWSFSSEEPAESNRSEEV